MLMLSPLQSLIKYYQTLQQAMSQNDRRTGEEVFQQARNIHMDNITNSAILENRISYMEKRIDEHSKILACSLCNSGKVKAQKGFKRAFKTLSFNEQIKLYSRTCHTVKELKSKTKENPQKDLPSPGISRKELIDTTVYIRDKGQYKHWTVARIVGSCSTRKVTIPDSSMVLDMHDYLIRSAKDKEKNCFALQSIQDNEPDPTIFISNEGLSFEQTSRFFKKLFKLSLRDEISQVLYPNAQQTMHQVAELPTKKQSLPSKTIKVRSKESINENDTTTMVKEKSITLKLASEQSALLPMNAISQEMSEKQRLSWIRSDSFNSISRKLVPASLIDSLERFEGYNKVRDDESGSIYHQKDRVNIKKKYRFDSREVVVLDWLVDQINNYPKYKEWKRGLTQANCLKVFPSERTKLIHETHINSGKTCNYFYLRHHFTTQNPHSTSSQTSRIYYFYDKSVSQKLASSLFRIPQPLIQIDYVLWKFYEADDWFYLTVEAQCDHGETDKNKNFKMLDNFLGSLDLICCNNLQRPLTDAVQISAILFEDQYLEQISNIEDDEESFTEYYTVTDSYTDQKPSLPVKETNSTSVLQNISRILKRKSVSFEQADPKNEGNVLKFKHPLKPYKKGPPNIKKPVYGSHPQWEKEWQLNSKGELINCNKEKIEAQNSVLKGVFKIIGRNLATGKSILNVSIPVQVFGDDSNLSRLCNSYGYAPHFLEQASKSEDPVERFKQVVAFSMCSTVLYLRMDKPFNPILGQTYQCLVDGCPIYGQQISHHPPISSVFLKGRGYSVYGSLEAKVQLSLNSASGSNEGQVTVCFSEDDLSKQTIQYTTPAGELSGVIYGDRKMAMIKKSHFYDRGNKLYCQFTWGKHKGKSETSNKFADSVQGQLVRLKSEPKDWKAVKKEQIETSLGLFSGRWTGAVQYEGETVFDTYQIFPFQIESYKALLESDTSKRKDLILRRDAVNMEEAQLAKEELEEIQRRDRKLRAEHGPKK